MVDQTVTSGCDHCEILETNTEVLYHVSTILCQRSNTNIIVAAVIIINGKSSEKNGTVILVRIIAVIFLVFIVAVQECTLFSLLRFFPACFETGDESKYNRRQLGPSGQ